MLLHELRGVDRILLRIERAVLRQDVLCGDAEADELPPGDIRFVAAVGEYLSPEKIIGRPVSRYSRAAASSRFAAGPDILPCPSRSGVPEVAPPPRITITSPSAEAG